MTQPPADNRTTPTSPGAPEKAPAVGPRRRAISDRAFVGSGREKRSPRMVAASVLLHVAAIVGILQLLTYGHTLTDFLQFGKDDQKEERLTYVATRPTPPAPTPAKPTPTAEPRTVTPPAAVPSAPVQAPPVAAPPARADTGSGEAKGTGKGVGELNPNLQGVKPSFGDPRVWQGPQGNGVAPSRNGIEMLDSIIALSIMLGRD